MNLSAMDEKRNGFSHGDVNKRVRMLAEQQQLQKSPSIMLATSLTPIFFHPY